MGNQTTMTKLISFGLLLLTLLLPSHTMAEDAEDQGEPETLYVELKPAFVTNYLSRKMGYIKADVTLQVSGSATAAAIERHKPAIRHNLVMLFSRQEEAALGTVEGKQALKETALQEVISALQQEGEPSDITDILFTSFIVD